MGLGGGGGLARVGGDWLGWGLAGQGGKVGAETCVRNIDYRLPGLIGRALC